MNFTPNDYQLSASRAAHAHLVHLHSELSEKIVLAWLRENRQHPHAGAIDTAITLYRLHEKHQDLYDAIALVEFYEERKAP
jgi:hypothetical protein